MPPADLAGLRDAIATVRPGRSVFHSPTAYAAACELIARHFLALLDAGELVLKVKCAACGGDGFAYDLNERDEHGDAPCEGCNANGYNLEPLAPTETAS